MLVELAQGQTASREKMTVAVAKVALLKWRKKTRVLQLKCSKGKITKTERYFKTALVWFVMMTVMRSSSLLSLTPASPNSSRLEPLFSNSVNWEFLHNVLFWLFVGAPQLYYQALSHPLKSHRRVGGCVWTEGHMALHDIFTSVALNPY